MILVKACIHATTAALQLNVTNILVAFNFSGVLESKVYYAITKFWCYNAWIEEDNTIELHHFVSSLNTMH